MPRFSITEPVEPGAPRSREDLRNARETLAFRVMLQAAMTRVLAEAAGAKKAYPNLNPRSDPTVEAYAVRQCITKGAFAELRAAFVKQGSPLTGEFMDLEREIDSFSGQWGIYALSQGATMPVRKGKHAGLDEQLGEIEAKARALREKAGRDDYGMTLPADYRSSFQPGGEA